MTKAEATHAGIANVSPEFSKGDTALQDCKSTWRDDRFEITDHGLYFESDDGRVRVADRFSFHSRTRDFDGSSHGIRIEWMDEDGTRHEDCLLFKDMVSAGKMTARLADLGFRIEHGQERTFLHALKAASPARQSRVVKRPGWHPGNAFVLPTGTVSRHTEEVSLLTGPNQKSHFAVRGTLSDWKKQVAPLAKGNSRLMFAISVALAGPLLDPVQGESVTFHMYGPSSIGKTTAARLAATPWGAPGIVDGFLQPWKCTSNSLELMATSRCDTSLILAQIDMADRRELPKAAFILTSGFGKARMASDRSHAPTSTSRLSVLSTGHHPFQYYLSTSAQNAFRGHSVPIASLPADAGKKMGILEDIHDAASPSKFISALHAACNEAYGTAGPALVQHVASNADRCASTVLALTARFVEDNTPTNADGQVRRVCGMFGHVAATGAIASDAGILPWNRKEAIAAVATCFNAWLAERGHCGSQELSEGIRILREQLLQNEVSGITQWGTVAGKDTLGYRREGNGHMDGLYLYPWHVRKILKDFDVNAIISELRRQGFARTEKKRTDRLAYHPVTHRNTRFFCISLKFLDEPKAQAYADADADDEHRQENPTAPAITT